MMPRALLAAALAVTVWAAPVAAQALPNVSINFFDPGTGPNPGANLAPTDVAGVTPLANWNNVSAANGGPTGNLMTSAGTSFANLSVTIANSPNTWSIPSQNLPNSPDGRMMQGYIDTNNTSITSITVSGLLSAGFTGSYNVVAYGIGDSQANRVGDYTIGTQSFRMLDNTQFNGTFVQSTAPGGSGPGQSGNYVMFTAISGDSFLLTAQAAQDINGVRAPVNGIQIIAAPEPAHLLLGCAAVCGGIAAWRRRRTLA
jgi:hypothetical protein